MGEEEKTTPHTLPGTMEKLLRAVIFARDHELPRCFDAARQDILI